MSKSVDDGKTDSRQGRLSLRKTNEEVLRKKFLELAKVECKEYFHAFGDCAKENGLLVVINCRQQNRKMSDCMDRYYNEKRFQDYLVSLGHISSKSNSDIR